MGVQGFPLIGFFLNVLSASAPACIVHLADDLIRAPLGISGFNQHRHSCGDSRGLRGACHVAVVVVV